ncbi:MAG: HNH endonuclease [Candidatus Binatia bacterium]|nr:HNH endonuclease [Candidatus Binatia bacterium]
MPRLIKPIEDVVLVNLYTVKHLTYRQIGAKLGLSATQIMRRLRKLGISSHQGTWLTRECAYCHQLLQIRRAKARHSKRSFCSYQCYITCLRGPEDQPYIQWRNGSLIAREIVSKLFLLELKHVVHHRDRDQTNNQLSNLCAFSSHSDHMAYHRGNTSVQPIWGTLS